MAATQAELEAAQALLDAEKAAQKVTFDERQQEKVTELIKAAKGEAAKELRAERDALKAASDALQAQLEAAKADLAKSKTPSEKKDAKGDVEALQAQIAEMRTVTDGVKAEAARLKAAAELKAKEAQDARELVSNYKRDAAIREAAGKVGFYDPADVATATSASVSWDEDRKSFVVIENGTVRLNNAIEPMSLEEYYQEFAAKKPYLVRGDVKGGAGSKLGDRPLSSDGKHELADIFGPKADGGKANALKKSNPAEYARLKVLAKQSGLIY